MLSIVVELFTEMGAIPKILTRGNLVHIEIAPKQLEKVSELALQCDYSQLYFK